MPARQALARDEQLAVRPALLLGRLDADTLEAPRHRPRALVGGEDAATAGDERRGGRAEVGRWRGCRAGGAGGDRRGHGCLPRRWHPGPRTPPRGVLDARSPPAPARPLRGGGDGGGRRARVALVPAVLSLRRGPAHHGIPGHARPARRAVAGARRSAVLLLVAAIALEVVGRAGVPGGPPDLLLGRRARRRGSRPRPRLGRWPCSGTPAQLCRHPDGRDVRTTSPLGRSAARWLRDGWSRRTGRRRVLRRRARPRAAVPAASRGPTRRGRRGRMPAPGRPPPARPRHHPHGTHDHGHHDHGWSGGHDSGWSDSGVVVVATPAPRATRGRRPTPARRAARRTERLTRRRRHPTPAAAGDASGARPDPSSGPGAAPASWARPAPPTAPSSRNCSASTRWRSNASRGIAREIHTWRVSASATQAVRPSSGTQ